MGFFGAAHGYPICGQGGGKRPSFPKICDTSYNDETWHTYTLPKEDPRNT